MARPAVGRGPGRRRAARAVPAVRAAPPLPRPRRRARRGRPRLLLLLLARAARGRAAGRAGGRAAAALRGHVPAALRRRGAPPRRAAESARWSGSACRPTASVVFGDLVRGRVAFHTSVIGDPVLLRSDGSPAYNFAVVVDDALMEVTHVVRGEDHISNTPRQILIYEALGFTPPAFAHLALVMGPDHTPLSKRHGATSVAEFRAQGVPARGAGELPRADRLVAGRRRGAAAGRRTGAPVRHRGGRAQRRRVRRGEARLGGPPLPADRRPGADREPRAGVLSPRGARARSQSGGARLPRLGRADGVRVGRPARRDSRPAALPVLVRSGGGARRIPTCARCWRTKGRAR